MLLPSIGVADVFQAAAIPVTDGDTFQMLTDEKQRIQIRMADTDRLNLNKRSTSERTKVSAF